MPDTLLTLADKGSEDLLALRDGADAPAASEEDVHLFRSHLCDTERAARSRDGLELVVDAGEGIIPLWERNSMLRWRFQERSLARFRDPGRIKDTVRGLLSAAVTAWGESVPIRFSEDNRGSWDFEIAVRDADRCGPTGCTLARAFFPGQGQHDLIIYPKMFSLSADEQMETMAHEIGHIFGLRHFFALVSESGRAAHVFGEHVPTSIMNYGEQSRLTETDRADLKRLYEMVWRGELTDINRIPIRQIRPFSSLRV